MKNGNIQTAVLLVVLILSKVGYSDETLLGLRPRPILDNKGHEIGLFERVVSRPGALVVNTPGSIQAVESPAPFTTYYVYHEKELAGLRYFQVGANSAEPPTGWVVSTGVIEWPNNVTLAFNEPVNRHPVLFFETPAGLGWLLSNEQEIDSRSSSLVANARSGTIESTYGVTAIEPNEFVHWSDRFYIMPVLDFVIRNKKENGSKGRAPILVKTAAIPVNDNKPTSASCFRKGDLGVVFVVDTTLSMQPYIDRTRYIMETLVKKFSKSDLFERVSFGLVGYRDKPLPNNDVKYRLHTFQDLDPKNDSAQFVNILSKVSAAEQSTEGFSEDGLAGVLSATKLNWDPYQNRWIILITDAGVRDPTTDEDGAKWGLDAVANMLWNEKNIGVLTLHLATPDAKASGNVAVAEPQLRKLAQWASTASGYIRIEDGDINAFGSVIDAHVEELIEHLNKSNAQLAKKGAAGNAIAEIGLAQRLIWLGACSQTAPPDIVEGWVMDKALGVPATTSITRYVFEPRILLNRLQMNELVKTLSSIVETAKSTIDSPEYFFAKLALALGTASSDANQINNAVVQGRLAKPSFNIEKISDVLPGYLARLPYRSDFLTIDQRNWSRMGPQQIRPWIDRVEAAIDTLRIHYNKKEDELYKLHPKATPGEWVYPVLISDLP